MSLNTLSSVSSRLLVRAALQLLPLPLSSDPGALVDSFLLEAEEPLRAALETTGKFKEVELSEVKSLLRLNLKDVEVCSETLYHPVAVAEIGDFFIHDIFNVLKSGIIAIAPWSNTSFFQNLKCSIIETEEESPADCTISSLSISLSNEDTLTISHGTQLPVSGSNDILICSWKSSNCKDVDLFVWLVISVSRWLLWALAENFNTSVAQKFDFSNGALLHDVHAILLNFLNHCFTSKLKQGDVNYEGIHALILLKVCRDLCSMELEIPETAKANYKEFAKSLGRNSISIDYSYLNYYILRQAIDSYHIDPSLQVETLFHEREKLNAFSISLACEPDEKFDINSNVKCYFSESNQNEKESFSCGFEFCIEKATFQCSRCKSVRYCSAAHQKKHWRFHKFECVEISSTTTNNISKPNDVKKSSISDDNKEEITITSSNISEKETENMVETSAVRECRCMFCGENMVLESEDDAIQHLSVCSNLQEQLSGKEDITIPSAIRSRLKLDGKLGGK